MSSQPMLAAPVLVAPVLVVDGVAKSFGPVQVLFGVDFDVRPGEVHATRIPSGHPEGYMEGFAQLYRDTADLIGERLGWVEPDPQARLVPTVRDGVRGVRFIHAAVESSRQGAAWVTL